MKNHLKKENTKLKKIYITNVNVHPNAFDLSADVHYFCKIKPRFSNIYIYTQKSVIRSTPKKRSNNVDTTN